MKTALPGTDSRIGWVTHGETYGRRILQTVCPELTLELCADLGCAAGEDLMIVKRSHPEAQLIGIDAAADYAESLKGKGIEPITLDIETQALPFEDECVDLVIANQVLEHTKQVFFINHEVFRTLKVGGHLYLGVPNVLSLHNRLLGLVGVHPTCAKLISGHVRVFSRRDVIFFYEAIAGRFTALEGFYGAQFYPFPRRIARPLATLLPSLAVSIFFLIRKTAAYQGEFVDWLPKAELETNFYRGDAWPT
jgi:SAM-dependent methyltransferase